jgi:uncharacterized protein with PQ loop repeat
MMSLHTAAMVAGYVGSGLGVAMVVPQILLTLRNRSLPGVSALSWAMTSLSCTGWLLYGVRTREIPQIPGNVLLISGAVAIVLLVPSGTAVRQRAAGLAGGALVLGLVATLAPAALLGATAFAIGMVSAIPQIVTSMTPRTHGGSAVSLLTWSLRVASQACWFGYAFVIGDVTVMVSAAFLMLTALLVVSTELARGPAPARAVALA